MKNIAKFFYELGQLKKIKRSGWWIANIKDPETVAEHSFRAIMVGRILAELEGADINKVTTMLLFHDIPETRINDIHKIGSRYIDNKKAEELAVKDQVKDLPSSIAKEMLALYEESAEKKTKEAIIAKDADLLECAITAKEYIELGYKDCQDWINNVEKRLKSKTAKDILELVKKTPSNSWWQGLKNIPKD